MRRGSLSQRWLINLGCVAALLVGPLSWIDAGAASNALSSDASALKACIASRSVGEDSEGYQKRFKLSDHCPDVISALSKLPATDLFDKGLHDETTLDQLRDIEALFSSYHATYTYNQRFDYKGLDGLLASTLVTSPKPRTTWWHQFMEWLTQWLNSKLTEKGKDDLRWLIDLLKWVSPSKEMLNLMFKSTLVLILVLAVIVIANGWRASSPFSWRLRRRTAKLDADDASAQARQRNVSWDEIVRLPPPCQPTALLRFVIGILTERGLLPRNHSLTNRELLMRLHHEDPTKADGFELLMVHAESALYGDRPIAPAQVQDLFQAADALLGRPVQMRAT